MRRSDVETPCTADSDLSITIFDFSLTEEDMRALRGLDRGWRACMLEGVKSHPYYPFV